MIIALLIIAFAIGCLLGRLYSYVALLLVSPLLAFVSAMAAWTTGGSGTQASLLGLFAMALSQVGYLAGVVLDPRSGFRKTGDRASREQDRVERHQASGSKH